MLVPHSARAGKPAMGLGEWRGNGDPALQLKRSAVTWALRFSRENFLKPAGAETGPCSLICYKGRVLPTGQRLRYPEPAQESLRLRLETGPGLCPCGAETALDQASPTITWETPTTRLCRVAAGSRRERKKPP